MKKIPLLLVAAILLLTLSSSAGDQTTLDEPEISSGIVGMGNPSAVYCQELGYEFKTVPDPEGERGICILPEGQECDAWDFLEGECGQDHSYCAQQGLDTVLKHDGKNGLTQSYAVCVDENGAEIGAAVELMDLEEKTLGCGVGKQDTILSTQVDGESAPPLDFTPPASFDWTDNGGNWLTPIRNQASCGSCWAFAVVGVTESAINIARDDPAVDLNLSEQYLVADCQVIGSYQNCCGGYKSYALDYIQDYGIPDDACMPYVDGSTGYDGTKCTCNNPPNCDSGCNYNSSGLCSDQQCSDRCGDWDSRLVVIEDFDWVNGTDRDNIKGYLVDYGPLTVSMRVESNIYSWPGDVNYTCSGTGPNHAVVIVGYDDAGGYWKVRNSWGIGWGDNGYFRVGYGECEIEDYVYYVTYNDAPNTPSDPAPADAAGDASIYSDLSWTGGDPNPGDTVTYNVYFEADDPTPDVLACDDAGSESCDNGTLLEGTTYYWQVISEDNYGATAAGPVWSFTTETAVSLDRVGMYSRGQKTWYLKDANDDGWSNVQTARFGSSDSSWTPVAGDWNGDGTDTIGMYSRTQKTWYLKDANDDGWANVTTVRFGSIDTSWIPVGGDWDGDGTDTIGMYSRTQKTWYLKDANNDGWANVQTVRFGSVDSSWLPVVGNWNGDGTDTIGMYSRTQKTWYLKAANDDGWGNVTTVRFGSADTGWLPVVGDWNENGADTIGMYSRTQKTWYLKDANNDGWSNIQTVRFGSVDTNWIPVSGKW